MKVLALVTDAYGGYGGIAQYNRDFLEAVARMEAVQQVVVLPRLAPETVEGLPLKTSQREAIHGRVSYGVRALWTALREKPDVVFNGHLYHGPLAHRVARLSHAKLVSQLHGSEIWGGVSELHKRPLEQSDLVLSASRDTRARLLAKTNVTPERAVVLNNTVAEDFNPGDRATARARFGVESDLIVLTVARLDARKGHQGYKGHERIIQLVAPIRAKGIPLVYLVAGVGDDLARLETLAATHGVEEHVRFLRKVPREHLPDLYRAADLFALPSTREGFGIAFLESMSCGTPAIGLAAGGAVDALADGELGTCVSEADFPAAFENCLASRAPDRNRLAAAVRARYGVAQFRERVGSLLMLLSDPASGETSNLMIETAA
ncbi:MAG: glycosyltransferase family 4 protein [bacterium]|nr:glycosyltransferase family 4 protein [bacterium]